MVLLNYSLLLVNKDGRTPQQWIENVSVNAVVTEYGLIECVTGSLFDSMPQTYLAEAC